MFSKMSTIVTGVILLLALVSSAWGESVFFFEQLADGDQVDLIDNGPFSLAAECSTRDGDAHARLWLTVDASNGDEWVYGMPDYAPLDWMGSCVGTYPMGTSESCVVYFAGAGNSGNGVAFQSLSGYYIGLDSDSTIAFNKNYDFQYYHDYYSYDLAAFPSDYTCAISGFINYAGP